MRVDNPRRTARELAGAGRAAPSAGAICEPFSQMDVGGLVTAAHDHLDPATKKEK
jgi:hypothetical protein